GCATRMTVSTSAIEDARPPAISPAVPERSSVSGTSGFATRSMPSATSETRMIVTTATRYATKTGQTRGATCGQPDRSTTFATAPRRSGSTGLWSSISTMRILRRRAGIAPILRRVEGDVEDVVIVEARPGAHARGPTQHERHALLGQPSVGAQWRVEAR